jgi:Ca2+-transporting ATPase
VEKDRRDILSLGLTDNEVEISRRTHGTNALTPPKRASWFKLYLEKFQDPIIRILLVAACLSLVVAFVEQDFAETIGIFCAIFLATGIGFYFEFDAGKKFDALNAIREEAPIPAIRNRRVTEIPRCDVVVNDILLLEQGDEVPADGELVEAVALSANESNLTGELMTHKNANKEMADKEATYPSYMLYRSTTIVEGHCVMRVTAVGDHTEIGHVAHQATRPAEEDTPLNIQLNHLAKLISKVGMGVAAAAFVIFSVHDLISFCSLHPTFAWKEWVEVFRIVLNYFMMAVTLIVMAVPEGLPMAVTLSLALNMRRMLKTNNLVRKLHACETMGAITVICTDKTGTLTQNKMHVEAMEFDKAHVNVFSELIAMNSTAYLDEDRNGGIGNPTEVALLLWLQENNIDYLNIREQNETLGQLPFSTENKYMATLVYSAERKRKMLYIKGAAEMLMPRCKQETFDEKAIRSNLLSYQQRAMRTISFAYKEIDDSEQSTDCKMLFEQGGLTWLGFAAITDPVRPEVPEAVDHCLSAGIKVKIVTGDTSATAIEIARQIGLWKKDETEQSTITGSEFAALTDEEAIERAQKLKVMSRAKPLDKLRLVQCLQHKNEVLAVTGDGTNDAPALNFAQVGLSMGSGTSVAKEASDITLIDDSFRSICTAVLWGRSLYKNIQRFLLFQLTVNVAALFIVLIGSFVGTELPLTVTQILWVNLIMDTFAAMALASLPPDVKVMKECPRSLKASILTHPMLKFIFGVGILFVIILFGLMLYFAGFNGAMNPDELTIFFTVFVMLQFWNLFNVRTFFTTDSAFSHVRNCKAMLLVLVIIGIGQFIIVQFGGRVFRTVPLSALTWVEIILSTSLVLWVGEIIRALMRLKKKPAGAKCIDKTYLTN